MDGVLIVVAEGKGALARSVSAIAERLVRGLTRLSLADPRQLFTAEELCEAVAVAIEEERQRHERYPLEGE